MNAKDDPKNARNDAKNAKNDPKNAKNDPKNAKNVPNNAKNDPKNAWKNWKYEQIWIFESYAAMHKCCACSLKGFKLAISPIPQPYLGHILVIS